MKYWKKWFPLIIIFFLIISWTGLPINTKMEEYGCTASYKKYIVPNFLCQLVTHWHCTSTDFNKGRAEREIALCLCDEYLENPEENIGNSIVEKCEGYFCQATISNMRNENCPSEYWGDDSSRDCMIRYIEMAENLSENVNFICENKEKIFYQVYIY